MGQDEAAELRKGNIIFAIDLEVIKDEGLFLSVAAQPQSLYVTNELRFGLRVGVHGISQVKETLRDKVGIGG